MADEEIDFQKLSLINVIGFNGSVAGGLKIHPDKQHSLYPLGCTVVIEDLNTKEQSFLEGHTNTVVTIEVSSSGKYVASGQITHMGYKADIILWDYETKSQLAKFILHKVKVQALAFSPNEKYLASLGGQDDGSVVIWSLNKKEAICGSPAQHKSAGVTQALCYSNHCDDTFVTGGENTLRVWSLDLENRKIRPQECNLGSIKRNIKCINIAQDDSMFYCGTSTGDILGVNMKSQLLNCIGPEKDKFSLGITTIIPLIRGDIIVGGGDGTVALMRTYQVKEGKKTVTKVSKSGPVQTVLGDVTSIALRGQGHQFYVATDKCHIYRFTLSDFKHELVSTCHGCPINDIVFPNNCSDLFVTCSHQDVRVFHTMSQKELLRINIPNMTCYSVDVFRDGTAIVSGWNDSKIRAFYPETGRLMYTIHDAHKKAVTAVATTSDCRHIISGGGEGQVRVWKIEESNVHQSKPYIPHSHGRTRDQNPPRMFVTSLVAAMKEHANAVSCIRMGKDDTQCVSSSADGTCIIWDLLTFSRKQIMFANTLFRCVCWGPDECQVITSGTDRKIGYWEVYDGSLIRELDGSRSGSVNGMDCTANSDVVVTGGDDKIVKVWKYNEGDVTHVGLGHSTPITRIRICPSQQLIISVSEDGAICYWKFPDSLK